MGPSGLVPPRPAGDVQVEGPHSDEDHHSVGAFDDRLLDGAVRAPPPLDAGAQSFLPGRRDVGW